MNPVTAAVSAATKRAASVQSVAEIASNDANNHRKPQNMQLQGAGDYYALYRFFPGRYLLIYQCLHSMSQPPHDTVEDYIPTYLHSLLSSQLQSVASTETTETPSAFLQVVHLVSACRTLQLMEPLLATWELVVLMERHYRHSITPT